jgi:hypothetical protein
MPCCDERAIELNTSRIKAVRLAARVGVATGGMDSMLLFDGRTPRESLGEGLITVVPFAAHPFIVTIVPIPRTLSPVSSSTHP